MEKKHFYCRWPETVYRDGWWSGGYIQASLSCEYIRARDCLSAYPAGFVRCGDDNSSLSANGVYYQLSICWWSHGWLSSWKPEVVDSQWDASKQMHEISECVPYVTPNARWKLRTGSFMFGRLRRRQIDPFYLLNKCVFDSLVHAILKGKKSSSSFIKSKSLSLHLKCLL